jgi:hypothetical protein
MVDSDGIVKKIIGKKMKKYKWKKINCEGKLNVEEVNLSWKNEIDISNMQK